MSAYYNPFNYPQLYSSGYYNFSSPPRLPTNYAYSNIEPVRRLNFCEQCGCIMAVQCTVLNGEHGIMVNGKFYTTVKEILGETCFIDPRPILEKQSSPVIYYPTMGIFEKMSKMNLTIASERKDFHQIGKLFNCKYFKNGNVSKGLQIFMDENFSTGFYN